MQHMRKTGPEQKVGIASPTIKYAYMSTAVTGPSETNQLLLLPPIPRLMFLVLLLLLLLILLLMLG